MRLKPATRMTWFAIICCLVFYGLALLLPVLPSRALLSHRVLAGVVLLLTLVWFGAEIFYGGGDPNR